MNFPDIEQWIRRQTDAIIDSKKVNGIFPAYCTKQELMNLLDYHINNVWRELEEDYERYTIGKNIKQQTIIIRDDEKR